jgi:hypothetical protein
VPVQGAPLDAVVDRFQVNGYHDRVGDVPERANVVGSHHDPTEIHCMVGSLNAPNYDFPAANFVDGTYTINYGLCLLYDTTTSYEAGSTAPLKLYLCNASGGDVYLHLQPEHEVALAGARPDDFAWYRNMAALVDGRCCFR